MKSLQSRDDDDDAENIKTLGPNVVNLLFKG